MPRKPRTSIILNMLFIIIKSIIEFGYVFRNRYKSEEILSIAHLLSCINYIHNNPVKANMCEKIEEYKFSSYNNYNRNSKILDVAFIKRILQDEGIEFNSIFNNNILALRFVECDEVNIDKDNICREKINEFLKKHKLKMQELKESNKELKQLILNFYQLQET